MPRDNHAAQEFDPAGPLTLDDAEDWASRLDQWIETEDGQDWLKHLDELAAAEAEREVVQAIHGRQ